MALAAAKEERFAGFAQARLLSLVPLSLWVVLVSALFSALYGCSCGAASPRGNQSTTEGATSEEPAGQASTSTPERPPHGRLVGSFHPVRGLSLRLEQLEGLDRYAGAVRLEKRDQGATWRAVQGVEASLHASCEATDVCRTLRAGGIAQPPPYVWPVKIGAVGTPHAECACERCMDLPAGEYRLLATTCEGSQSLASEPFWIAAR